MCTIIGLDQAANCIASDGGIFESYATEFSNILTITFAATTTGEIMVITHTVPWVKFVYDDDDSAFYNQEGERTNNKVDITQEAFLKFAGINAEKNEAVNKIISCCAMVWIHRFNSGLAIMQGIDRDMSLSPGDTDTFSATKKKAKVTPNVMSDTGDNEDRVEYTINSTGRHYSPPLDPDYDFSLLLV